MNRKSFVAALAFLFTLLVSIPAMAAGSFSLKTKEVQEVSGAWHIFVTLELPKAPAIAHQPLRFVFTKQAVYERALVDGKSEPVTSRQSLRDQAPTFESLDVDFADSSGKIFKGTRFDFGLTRARGYEAGEYKVTVRTSDGLEIGGAQMLTLKGENPVVDRRSMTFNASSGIKKVGDADAGATGPKKNDTEAAEPTNGDVAPVGSAPPFIPPEAYNKTPEEELKVKPSGCGCTVPGAPEGSTLLWFAPLLAVGLAGARRKRA